MSALVRRLPPIFLLSGFAALVYQVVWQRALFAIFGIDTESVTIVVAAFMLGLGIGSHLGGELSRKYAAPPLFAAFEIAIGVFGFFSLSIFEFAGKFGLEWSRLGVGFLTFILVLLPTTLMGATLPLLVAYTAKTTGNTGRSVGTLYFMNTLGAALACFVAGWFMLGHFGMRGTTIAAGVINVLIGLLVLVSTKGEEAVA